MKSFIMVSGGNIVRQLLTFFAQIYIVKKLGVHAFGELTIAFSIYLVIAGISDFGSRLYCWKEVLASDPDERPLSAVREWMARTALSVLFLLPILSGIALFFHGVMETLLLTYAMAIVANQAAFDWFFLAQDKMVSLFIFNAFSGVLYFLLLVALVRAEGDLQMVPIAFIVSYVLPAAILMWKDLWKLGAQYLSHPRKILEVLRAGARIPIRSRAYFLYDFLQRLYMTSIFIVAWKYYSKSMIGQFRVAHLIFTLAASMATYLGVSLFNRVHEENVQGGSGSIIPFGIASILLVILPFSICGYGILAPIVKFLLDSQFNQGSLLILIAGLSLPALGNFIRETAVAAGQPRIATLSYLLTIGVTIGLIVAIHPSSLSFLAGSLLIGEGLGLIFLLAFLPIPLISKVRFRTYWVGGLAGGVFLAIEEFISIINHGTQWMARTMEMSLIILGLFIIYILKIRKIGGGFWIYDKI